MTLAEAMKQLESYGTAQNRKVYARHGADENMFGVSYANLYAMQKKIKVDHELAGQLWATVNHDARVLATLIADPNRMTDKQAEGWAKSLTNYGLTGMLVKLIGKTPLARKKAEKWMKSKEEFIGQAGWGVLAVLALNDTKLPDGYFESYLKVIESDIHKRKNYVRYEMNNALIAIGLRNDKLGKKALAAGAKIGKVEVDHGETNCKTPDAAEYIKKAQYRHKKIARA